MIQPWRDVRCDCIKEQLDVYRLTGLRGTVVAGDDLAEDDEMDVTDADSATLNATSQPGTSRTATVTSDTQVPEGSADASHQNGSEYLIGVTQLSDEGSSDDHIEDDHEEDTGDVDNDEDTLEQHVKSE